MSASSPCGAGPVVISMSVARTYRVVTPCDPGAVYCPSLPAALRCGSAPCAPRAALAALDPNADDATAQAAPIYTVQFNARVPGSRVSTGSDGAALYVQTPCGTPPPLALAFCDDTGTDCGAYVTPDSSDESQLSMRVTPALEPRPLCVAARIATGACAGGNHTFMYQATRNGGANASDSATLHVAVLPRLTTLDFAVNATLRLESDATDSSADAVQDALSGGGSELLNPLLRSAAARSAATLDACMRAAGVAFEPDTVPGVALRANTNATNTARITGPDGVTSMNVRYDCTHLNGAVYPSHLHCLLERSIAG